MCLISLPLLFMFSKCIPIHHYTTSYSVRTTISLSYCLIRVITFGPGGLRAPSVVADKAKLAIVLAYFFCQAQFQLAIAIALFSISPPTHQPTNPPTRNSSDLAGNWQNMSKMEDDQIGRRQKWKTTKIEDNQNRRQPKWKMTKMEDDLNGRWPKWKMT